MGGISKQSSSQQSSSGSKFFAPQAGAFRNALQLASGTLRRQTSPGSRQQQQQFSRQLTRQGQRQLKGLGGLQDLLAQLSAGQGGGGQEFLQGIASGEGGGVQEQIDLLGGDINTQLAEQILPALQSAAVASGGGFGSRAGIASGLAAQGAQDAFSAGATGIRSNELNRQLQASQALQGGQLQAAGLGSQAANLGFSALPQLFNLSQAGNQAQFSPFLNFAQLLGTGLNQTSFGQGSGSSSGFSASVGG